MPDQPARPDPNAPIQIPKMAQYLHLPEHTVRVLLRRGDLPGTKVGKRWVSTRKALSDHIRKHAAADTRRRHKQAEDQRRLDRHFQDPQTDPFSDDDDQED